MMQPSALDLGRLDKGELGRPGAGGLGRPNGGGLMQEGWCWRAGET